jgi:tripartite-type tricarboxylate transporter receptor subunit TctC
MPEEECMTRLLLAAVLATVLHVIGATAQEFPSRAITIVVPFPAGGPSDTLARILAERMRVPLHQPVVIENVTGAGASIGAIRGAQAPADGYTLSIGNWTSHVGSGAMYRLPFDLLTDLAPIALLTTAPLMIVGKNTIPASNGAELLAWLKQNSDKVAMATIGAGSAAHVCSVYLQNNIGTHMQFVPYRGGAPVMQDLVAGQIDLFCAEASQTLTYIRGGQMKAFMVMAKDRWPAAPEVQTVDEAGARGLYISFWHGLWAPKGTPQDVLTRLNAAVVETLADPGVHKRLTELGLVIATREEQTPQALAAHHKAELEKWWPIMKAANIKAEAN